MKTSKFNIGDVVAFAPAVIARTGHNKLDGDARGRVVSIVDANVLSIDFAGTWRAHEDGGTVRYVLAANLIRVIKGIPIC
jgi:hypothetical protein